MEFKDKLRQLRSKKGVTQTMLANSVLVSRSTVAKWKNGLSLPNEQSFDLLVQYFGVDKSQLLPDLPTEETLVNKNITISKTRTLALIVAVLCGLLIVALVTVFAIFFPKQQIPALEEIVSNGSTWGNVQLGGLSVKQLENKWGSPDDMSGEYIWITQDFAKVVVTAGSAENGTIVVKNVTVLHNIPTLKEVEKHDEEWAQQRLLGLSADKLLESWGSCSPLSGMFGYIWRTENQNRVCVYCKFDDDKKAIVDTVKIVLRVQEIPSLAEVGERAAVGGREYLFGFTIAELQKAWGAGTHDEELRSYLWQLSNGMVLRVWYDDKFIAVGSLIQALN